MRSSPTVSQIAMGDLRSSDRVTKLGWAVVALSRELAASRRDVARLVRENAELRRRLGRTG
jgi:hypothetical protein